MQSWTTFSRPCGTKFVSPGSHTPSEAVPFVQRLSLPRARLQFPARALNLLLLRLGTKKGCHVEAITERFCQSRLGGPHLQLNRRQVGSTNVESAIGAATLFGARTLAQGLRGNAEAARSHWLP